MDEAHFWHLIEQAKAKSNSDLEQQVELLEDALVQLPDEQIIQFGILLDTMMSRSYHNDLWGAAYIINGGCSDDGFDYFRGWLIAQGRRVFEQALQEPESLADVAELYDSELESILYVASSAYYRRTSNKLPLTQRSAWQLQGSEWTEETVYDLFPKLTARLD